jgi:Uncharacterised nucleotidyltransferase
MESLLDLLRGRLDERLKGRPFEESNLAHLLEIAAQENIVPWTAEKLRRLGAEFTPGQRKRIEEIQREAQLAAFVWTETLKSTLTAFARAGVPVIALKGPCLAERFYGDAALRTCYDLDLLVRGSDLEHTERLLAELGFAPISRADDYHRPWSRKSINLELHHNIENPHAFDFDVDAAWARAERSQFHGAQVWLLAPADELLYLCLHGVRHRFERLNLMLDLVLAFRRLPLVADAPSWGSSVFDNMFVLGWTMASRLDPELPVPQAMRISAADRRRIEELSDRLWSELMQAPPPTLDWKAQHRFYLEVESPGWDRLRRRWQHRRILVTRLIDDDFVFAGRFHLYRNWQVRLLRPVRLLMKSLRPAPKMI